MKKKSSSNIENLESSQDDFWDKNELQNPYGFGNILYILSTIITVGSVLTVIFLGNR